MTNFVATVTTAREPITEEADTVMTLLYQATDNNDTIQIQYRSLYLAKL